MRLRSTIAVLSAALAMTGCTTLTEPDAPRPTFYGPVPVATNTPMDAALRCLAASPSVRGLDDTFAVHIISDQTSRFAAEEAGGFLPRDSAGMMISLLDKAGVKQVNRSNTAVTEWEIARAREQILGDGGQTIVGNQSLPFRPLIKGSLMGSDYVIDGAITQLDFNSYSGGGEIAVGGIGGGGRIFAVTAAVDLRVTDTKTTEIVEAVSYSKQAVGHEVYASVFRFFSSELFDVKIGDKSQEGLQAAVRWLLAEAAYDIVSRMSGHGGNCDSYLPDQTKAVRGMREVAGEEPLLIAKP